MPRCGGLVCLGCRPRPPRRRSAAARVQADLWSLGITAIELAKGVPPLSDVHPMKALLLIPKQQAPALHGDYSRAFKELVELCLNKDPTQRPSARELLKHRFVARARQHSDVSVPLLVQRLRDWQAMRTSTPPSPSARSSPTPTAGEAAGYASRHWRRARWPAHCRRGSLTMRGIAAPAPCPQYRRHRWWWSA